MFLRDTGVSMKLQENAHDDSRNKQHKSQRIYGSTDKMQTLGRLDLNIKCVTEIKKNE